MRKSSSKRVKHRGQSSASSKTSELSAPPTAIYSSYSSSSSISYSVSVNGQGNDDGYDSTAEYEVTFPRIELKLPAEHVQHQPSVIREMGAYDQSGTPSIRSVHSRSSSSHTYQSSYNSQQRFQSLGNIFTSLVSFFHDNPNMTKVLFGVIMCYVVVCNLEVLIPKLISIVVRLLYPWARYLAVIAEQFFSTIANMFTRLDAVIYASYCEFSTKYCRSRRLMCDVSCSFVDHVLSQSRPQLAPVPQN